MLTSFIQKSFQLTCQCHSNSLYVALLVANSFHGSSNIQLCVKRLTQWRTWSFRLFKHNMKTLIFDRNCPANSNIYVWVKRFDYATVNVIPAISTLIAKVSEAFATTLHGATSSLVFCYDVQCSFDCDSKKLQKIQLSNVRKFGSKLWQHSVLFLF